MPLTFKPSDSKRSMIIVVHGRFDLSLACELWRTVRQGRILPTEEVVVDMGQVEAVFESGLVLLMVLRRWSHKVRVINFDAEASKEVVAVHLYADAVRGKSAA